jgi:hypothetical protein
VIVAKESLEFCQTYIDLFFEDSRGGGLS